VVRVSIAVAAALLTLLAGVRLWFLDGLLRPVTIDGPSMAPALCGLHYEVTCPSCAARFKCDAEHLPASGLAECFNCGLENISLGELSVRPPDRVLLDRWPLIFRGPMRHEVVACRSPDGSFTVKRVAALPSEHLRIDGGELYNGEQPLHKTLAQLRQVRILASVRTGQIPRANSLDEVTDYDAYNQGELRRPLNPVHRAWLECDVKARNPVVCRIWRDIYYLDPDGLSRPWQAPSPLTQDEYALLGDNQPVSVDSRHWTPAGVRKQEILGIVYRPFWERRP